MVMLKTHMEPPEKADADLMTTIWAQWQEIDDVVHYNSHFRKSRTAELMQQSYD